MTRVGGSNSCDPTRESVGTQAGSQVVKELRRLPLGKRKILGLEEWAVDLLDAVIGALFVLIDDDDQRSFSERMEGILAQLPEGDDPLPPELTSLLEKLPGRMEGLTENDVPRWARHLTRKKHWLRFVRRLVGARSYDRLVRAVNADGAVITEGMRCLAHQARPFAVAFDDLTAILTAEQISHIKFPDNFAAVGLRFMIEVDRVMEDLIASDFDWSVLQTLGDGMADQVDLQDILDQVRPFVSEPLQSALSDINERLARKLRGARTALELSDDGVSQAANSLIELIDWILRSAFPDDEVIQWLDRNGRGNETYNCESDRRKPTKRGQCLCFVYGAQDIDQDSDESALHEAMAAVVVTVRSKLQKLKHADTGSDEEKELVVSYLRAIEGFLTIAVRLMWPALPRDRIEELHTRLAA